MPCDPSEIQICWFAAPETLLINDETVVLINVFAETMMHIFTLLFQ